MGFLSFNHPLAEGWPGLRLDGEDDEDLKRVEALEGGLVWMSGVNESRELYESATFSLGIAQA